MRCRSSSLHLSLDSDRKSMSRSSFSFAGKPRTQVASSFRDGPSFNGAEAEAATSTRSSSMPRNSINESREAVRSRRPAGTGGSKATPENSSSCAHISHPRYKQQRSPRSRSERRDTNEPIQPAPSSHSSSDSTRSEEHTSELQSLR